MTRIFPYKDIPYNSIILRKIRVSKNSRSSIFYAVPFCNFWSNIIKISQKPLHHFLWHCKFEWKKYLQRHKKWSFQLRISSENVTTSTVSLINSPNLRKWNILSLCQFGNLAIFILSKFCTLYSTVKLKLRHIFHQFIRRFKVGIFEC